MRAAVALVLAVMASTAGAGTAAAQSSSDLLDQGVEAYQNLNLNVAAGFLRRALAGEESDTLADSERIRALTYLGATEVFRENRDSAQSAFRRIVKLDPRHAIDEIEFPPEVTSLFQLVRRDTKVVVAALPPTARIEAGSDIYTAQLFASSFHRIAVAVDRPDGTTVRSIYQGVIGDSLEVVWNGLDSDGRPLGAGRYAFRVQSTTPDGAVARVLRVPLDVSVDLPDTLVHPPPPADSLFRPETVDDPAGTRSLIAGLIVGAGVAVLPTLIAPDADASPARFAVGGAISVAGIVGFLRGRPGRTIAENVRANELLRSEWEARRDEVVRQNQARLVEVTLVIRAGRPSVVDAEGP
jgi:hypothetical protein